mgnify:CR=1 FL=1
MTGVLLQRSRANAWKTRSLITVSPSWCCGRLFKEASSELEEDYGLSSDVSQLWVAERLRQVSDSLVDRLAEKAVQHGTSKSNVARAADSDPTNAMRRFPRLRPGAVRTRLLIDEVLDSLE